MRPTSYRQRLFVEHWRGESSGSDVDAGRRAWVRGSPAGGGGNMLRIRSLSPFISKLNLTMSDGRSREADLDE